MEKHKDGTIGYKSDLEHRLTERLRSALKSKGYVVKQIKSKNHSTIRFEISKDGKNKNIFGFIRERSSDNVAMNVNDYNDANFDDNTYCVLLDRRHLYPIKYTTFSNLKIAKILNFGNYLLMSEEYLTSVL